MFYLCSMSDLHVVWFRRDLRVHDHAALAAACASAGDIVPLYVIDPEDWHAPEASARQFDFLIEALADLDHALRRRGSQLCLRIGPSREILSGLHARHGIAALYMNGTPSPAGTAGRDRDIRNWAMRAGVPLRETGGGHPVSSEFTLEAWQDDMKRSRLAAPDRLPPISLPSDPWPCASDFGLEDTPCPDRQTGGRTRAILNLRRFLGGAGRDAAKAGLSISARNASASALSPYLALGCLSEREVWQGAMKARAALLADGDTTFAAALDRFAGNLERRARMRASGAGMPLRRLTTRLEDDPHDRPAATGSDPRLAVWATGMTGFPILDAGMRCLRETGSLEAGLRELLLSFATCHLWLRPDAPCRTMARLSLDYDTALFDMNARQVIGIAGGRPAYIPNPVRQGLARDPDGAFIRKWVPELAALPDSWLHAPWEAPKSVLARHGIIFGQTYPMRMVDHMAAAREARHRLCPAEELPDLPYRNVAPRPAMRSASGRRKTARAARPALGPVQLSFDLQGHA
jgi:deoxyribodipyrimidine photo-lyase